MEIWIPLLKTTLPWACLWLVFALGLFMSVSSDLWHERARPGPGGSDYFSARLSRFLYAAHLAIALWDITKTPHELLVEPFRFVGFLLMSVAMFLIIWSMHVNVFFSSIVRVQKERNHQVISEGPYRWLRHPGYLGMLFLVLGSGLALGSLKATAVTLPWLFLTLRRIQLEEKTLKEGLKGYKEFVSSTPWRLIPKIY